MYKIGYINIVQNPFFKKSITVYALALTLLLTTVIVLVYRTSLLDAIIFSNSLSKPIRLISEKKLIYKSEDQQEEKSILNIGLSSIRCSGELEEGVNFGPSCKFTNLCIRDSSVFAILPENIATRPYLGLMWSSLVPLNQTAKNEHMRPFSYNRSQFQNGRGRVIGTVARTTGRSPSRNSTFRIDILPNTWNKSEVIYRDELLIPVSLYAAGNAGHLLWETLIPALGLASYFGYDLSPQGQPFRLLLLNHCEEKNDIDIHYGYPVENCHRYVNGFLHLLSDRQPVYLSKGNHHERGYPLCFSNVISGSLPFNVFTFERVLMPGVGARILRNLLFSRLGLTTIRPKCGPIRLTLQIKRSGRHFGIMVNREQVEDYIKKNFVSYKGVPITVQILNLDTTSIHDQIRMLAATDIYFSSAGSGLYMSTLLPDDAVVIGVPRCYRIQVDKNTTHLRSGIDARYRDGWFSTCSLFVEFRQIQTLPHVHVIPFPLRAADLVNESGSHYVLPIVYLNETFLIAFEEALAYRDVLSKFTSKTCD